MDSREEVLKAADVLVENGIPIETGPHMARDSYNWMSATVIIPDFAGGCRGR
jgi:hypothetical protein